MLKKILALLLVLCMLVVIVACGQTQNGDEGQTTEKTEQPTQAPGTSDDDPDALFQTIKDDLPVLNFENAEINVVVRSEERYYSEFIAEEGDSNVVSQAIFDRNLNVEERLGVLITYHPVGGGHGPWADIETSIITGDCEYDLLAGSAMQGATNFTKGLYKNLRNVEYLDLNKEYWAQGILDNQTIAGATFGVTGSISTYFYDSAFVIYFNRVLAEAWGVSPDDIYDLVLSGEWTIDKMMEISKNIYQDDGDGVEDVDDVFGMGVQVTSATDGFAASCMINLVSETEDGLQIAMDIARVSDVVTKLNSFIWDNPGVCALAENSNYVTNDIYLLDQQFANDKLLFVTDWLYSTSTMTMRDMESDFGVLPYPKYDVDQEYATYVHDKYTLFAIPVSVSAERASMIGAFMEAMASEGHNLVMPAYYEKALTSRYIRDPESVLTMDIIVRNITVDKLWSLASDIPRYCIRQLIWDKSTDVVSTYRKYYSNSQKTLDNLYVFYEQYADN